MKLSLHGVPFFGSVSVFIWEPVKRNGIPAFSIEDVYSDKALEPIKTELEKKFGKFDLDEPYRKRKIYKKSPTIPEVRVFPR